MMVEELRWPQLIATVETMKCDSTVATALDTKYVFITKAFNDFKILYNVKSEDSKKAAELIEYTAERKKVNMPGCFLSIKLHSDLRPACPDQSRLFLIRIAEH